MQLSHDAQAAIAKVEKLLNLARGNANADEAQNAMDMAAQILERYNLDMSVVEASKRTDTGRADQRKGGGLYKWQREVWEAAARLNFCHYVSIRGLERGSKYEQRIVGSRVNVLATTLMAEYLQDAIERLAREWAKDHGHRSIFVKSAIIFREGAATTITTRLAQLRYEREWAERERDEKAGAGSNLPSLARVSQQERDLNNDYLNGWEPGTTASNRAEREARMAAMAAKREKENAEKAARRLIDPAFDLECRAQEEADRQAALKWQKEWERKQARREKHGYTYRETAEDRRRQDPAYYSGRVAGYEVGLDPQVKQTKVKGIK